MSAKHPFSYNKAASAALVRQRVMKNRAAAISADGGKATQNAFAELRKELDGAIRLCLMRRESPYGHVKDWMYEYGVSKDTVYRAIKRIEREVAKK